MCFRQLIHRSQNDRGQSLLETALTIPLLLAVAFNLINFAYFWFMVLTLAAAPRAGVQYSVQGGTVSSTSSTPSTSAVTTVVTDNITNAVKGATTANVAVRVCSATANGGVNSTTGIANCDTNTAGSSFNFPKVDAACCADPEEPAFVLNRVDVGYNVTPIISGPAFGLFLPSSDALAFQRHASMRSLF
jgi:Flp pilus assembly protein TadG